MAKGRITGECKFFPTGSRGEKLWLAPVAKFDTKRDATKHATKLKKEGEFKFVRTIKRGNSYWIYAGRDKRKIKVRPIRWQTKK